MCIQIRKMCWNVPFVIWGQSCGNIIMIYPALIFCLDFYLPKVLQYGIQTVRTTVEWKRSTEWVSIFLNTYCQSLNQPCLSHSLSLKEKTLLSSSLILFPETTSTSQKQQSTNPWEMFEFEMHTFFSKLPPVTPRLKMKAQVLLLKRYVWITKRECMCVFVSEYFVHSVVILLPRQLGNILKENPVRLISFTPSLRFRAGAQVALCLNWAGVPWAVVRFAVFCSALPPNCNASS